jgi:hypothetical protein
MAKSDELVKYIAERFLSYVEMPKEQRKQVRIIQRTVREPWMSQWFGMVPYAIRMWIDSIRKKQG